MAGVTPSPFGELLKRYRAAAGLTQDELAERAGLSARTISDLERGIKRRPHDYTTQRLVRALDLTAEEQARLAAAGRPIPANLRVQAAAPVAGEAPGETGYPDPRAPSPGREGDVAAANRQVPSAARAAGAARHAASLAPLVGRGGELALLERFLAGVEDGGAAAPLLLLAGEPGIGKTRLLEVAAGRAIDRGYRVLAGGCHRHAEHEPYAPLLEALAHHLQARKPAGLEPELAGCAWLVRLLPELAGTLEPLPSGAHGAEQERRLMFMAVARFLANVAGPAGTLLVLDDLQWAGADALDLLVSLLRTGPASLRVVGAYRETELPPHSPLWAALADLAPAGLVRRHTVGPLDPAEADALLHHLLAGVEPEQAMAVRQALDRAGGIPFFLVSYAQALKLGSKEAVPWDLAQGVRQRVALLPPAGREMLAAAAVVGRRASWALLTAVAAQAEEAGLAGLEDACRARLLLEDGEDGYVFGHHVIRE
ncbi:MAG: AAA family ATPase, partial [Chloroflexi bacterium]|nr:AAA family ATPase [Chloroflexota bacterium]